MVPPLRKKTDDYLDLFDTNGQPIPALTEFRIIIKRLGIADIVTEGFKNRLKFPLLSPKKIGTRLFKTEAPDSFRTVFLPGVPAGVLQELQLALAEYKYGNDGV